MVKIKFIYILILILIPYNIFALSNVECETFDTYVICQDQVLAKYNIQNILLSIFLVMSFIFWFFIYLKVKNVKWDKKEYLRTITKFTLKILSWTWFIFIFYMTKVILFNSQSTTFLEDKLYLINLLLLLTIMPVMFIFIANIIKFMYSGTSIEEAIKNTWYEVKYGNDK